VHLIALPGQVITHARQLIVRLGDSSSALELGIGPTNCSCAFAKAFLRSCRCPQGKSAPRIRTLVVRNGGGRMAHVGVSVPKIRSAAHGVSDFAAVRYRSEVKSPHFGDSTSADIG
jgi:hypothetical protein